MGAPGTAEPKALLPAVVGAAGLAGAGAPGRTSAFAAVQVAIITASNMFHVCRIVPLSPRALGRLGDFASLFGVK